MYLGSSDSRRRQYNTPPASHHPLRDFLTLLPLHEYLVCHSLLSIFTVAGVQANPIPLVLGTAPAPSSLFLISFTSHPSKNYVPALLVYPLAARPFFPCVYPAQHLVALLLTLSHTNNSTSCLLNYYLPLRQPLLREQPLSMSCLDQKSQPGSPKRSRG